MEKEGGNGGGREARADLAMDSPFLDLKRFLHLVKISLMKEFTTFSFNGRFLGA